MDALEQFLGGGKASPITDDLLDRLKQVESSGNPKAVNPQSGAQGAYQFMPSTVKMLEKQGIKFDPFNEPQARAAAKTYLEQLVEQNGGDVNKALAAYGGFKTKDPTSYVQKVTSQPADALEAFLSGAPQSAQQPAQQPAPQEAAPQKQAAEKMQILQSAVPQVDAQGKIIRQPIVPRKSRSLGEYLLGGTEVLGNLASGMVAMPIAAAGQLGSDIIGAVGYNERPDPSNPLARKIAGALTYQPLTEAGQEMLGDVGAIMEASKLPPVSTPELMIPSQAGMGMQKGGPGLAKTSKAKMQQQFEARQFGSVGAAATPNEAVISQALQVVSPELAATIKDIPVNKVNIPALQRHIEADTLPVPIRLTKGEATGDVVLLSHEQNRRGQDPQLAQRFAERNQQLVENLEAFRDRAAPDAPGSRTIDHGQGIIDAYKTIDEARSAEISGAYKALEDAAGGNFPVDGAAIAKNAEAVLHKKLKTEFLSSSIKNQLEQFKNGEPMTFEQFEAMRTNLAAEIRKAERAGDGNAATAASIVRQAMEDLPLVSEAKGLKNLADTARGLAKNRFDALKKDPAYRAAVDDTVGAENFVNKFVVNGINKNIQAMIENLGADSVARQHMSAGTIGYLRDRAGIVNGQGNFSQAAFNKGLKFLDDANKLPLIFDGETATGLKTLGNVARYTQAQPRGSFVNNSNTLVAALAEKAKGLIGGTVERGLNVAVPGLQMGTTLMEARAARAAAKETQEALKPGAGIQK